MLSFFANLGTRRVEICTAHAQIVRRYFKGATGAGAGLFKYEGDVLSLADFVGDTCLFLGFESRRKVD